MAIRTPTTPDGEGTQIVAPTISLTSRWPGPSGGRRWLIFPHGLRLLENTEYTGVLVGPAAIERSWLAMKRRASFEIVTGGSA